MAHIPRPEQIVLGDLAYEDRYQSIRKVAARFPGGEKTFYVHDHGYRTGIVVPMDQGILLVRQYRLLIDEISLEIPGGGVAAGEDPKRAALRECREETGVACRDATSMLRYLPGMDIFRNPTEIFVGLNPTGRLRRQSLRGETTVPLLLPLDDLVAMIFEGRIHCGLTIMATLGYLQWRRDHR